MVPYRSTDGRPQGHVNTTPYVHIAPRQWVGYQKNHGLSIRGFFFCFDKLRQEQVHDPARNKVSEGQKLVAGWGLFPFSCLCQIGKRACFSRQWLWAWLIGTAYAATDELHQLTVAGRGPSVADVGIDSVGVALGIAVFAVCAWILRRKVK